ncbi:MAG TPA: SRPBCC domain-containing protein [Candidatus Eisenbacteria bacterium]|nr:SRPBCC domain-containing protein [Candidatus Eisenbacteria bacterium]
MELVFKALADPSRRALLDQLFEHDGQTLGQLCSRVAMTRFGVMKHLRLLEAADLVLTRRAGRAKFHYLNPVPIRLIHDRWITKYAAPWVGALGNLKRQLEEETMGGTITRLEPRTLRHIHQIHIRTTPERLWEAITRASDTQQYFYGTRVESTWKQGAPLVYRNPDGSLAADGTVLEADPPRKLVHMFSAHWDPEVSADAAHRVTWTIEPMGAVCRLTVEHEGFVGETATLKSVQGGLGVILDGLKTLLETGQPLMTTTQ